MAIREELQEKSVKRFWAKVTKSGEDECWLWSAALNEAGYGVFGVGKQTDKAHRISYRLTHGEIPKGMFICHHCDVRNCVNPKHLFAGTNRDNVKDMLKKGRGSKPPDMGGWNKKVLPGWVFKELGTRPDTEIAKKAGVTKHTIRRAREKLGVPAFPCPTNLKSAYLTRAGVERRSNDGSTNDA